METTLDAITLSEQASRNLADIAATSGLPEIVVAQRMLDKCLCAVNGEQIAEMAVVSAQLSGFMNELVSTMKETMMHTLRNTYMVTQLYADISNDMDRVEEVMDTGADLAYKLTYGDEDSEAQS
jgi:hypothetical protein